MLVYLIGLPGVGKTTIGKELAQKLTYSFVDLDDEIEKSTGLTVTNIFETRGEDYFREIEQLVLHKTFSLTNAIIATGGGTPCFFDNMELLNQNGISIYLEANPKDIVDRISSTEIKKRPLFKPETLKELLEKRKRFYEKASFKICTSEENLTDKITSFSSTFQKDC